MAEKTANEILDDMKNAQETLVDDNLKKYKAEKDKLAAADANAAAESAGGSADFQNYIMPDNNGGSIQSDAMSRLGLNKGELSETNLAGGYNAYQSRLAAAADAARRSQEQLDLSYGMYDAQSQAEKSNAQANYNAMRNSEYWKKANWDYQLAADKKAEDEAKKTSVVATTSNTFDKEKLKKIQNYLKNLTDDLSKQISYRVDYTNNYSKRKDAIYTEANEMFNEGNRSLTEEEKDYLMDKAYDNKLTKSDRDLLERMYWGEN